MNEGLLQTLLGIVLFAIAGPVVGCLLAGLDRKITARMQGRVGPPLLQPYYDVRKLIEKDDVSVNTVEGTYITFALVLTVIGGGVFVAGGNFLMCVFLITLSALFFIVAAYSSRSPYSEVGADRETLQVMAYEPTVLFVAVCMFLALGTFDVAGVANIGLPMIVVCIPAFLALMFVLTIKLRKSPFDLSYSHHAHQELVKGRHDRNERSHVGEGRGHALVRDHVVPGLGRDVLHLGQPSIYRARCCRGRARVLPRDLHRQQFRACEVAEVPEVGMDRGAGVRSCQHCLACVRPYRVKEARFE